MNRLVASMLALYALTAASHASAGTSRSCVGNYDRNCWVNWSGPNFTMVQTAGRFVCGVNPGPVGVVNGQPRATNNAIACYSLVNAGSSQKGSSVGPGGSSLFSLERNIQSFALQGPGNGAHGLFTLWALRSDGELFSNFISAPGTSNWSGWTHRAKANSLEHGFISLRMITVVQPPYGAASLYGVATNGNLYRQIGGGWSFVSGAGPFQVLFGDPYLGVGLTGTNPMGMNLAFYPPVQGAGTPPAMLGGQLLGASSSPPFSFLGSHTQPVSKGILDLWVLTRDNNFTWLSRSQFVNGAWGAWQGQDHTLYIPGGNQSIRSVVDGFQARDVRGSLFFIASTSHLLEWVP